MQSEMILMEKDKLKVFTRPCLNGVSYYKQKMFSVFKKPAKEMLKKSQSRTKPKNLEFLDGFSLSESLMQKWVVKSAPFNLISMII